MTGSLVKKTLSSGKSYYYVQLSYKDQSGNWKKKTIATKLEVKGNKRKAENLISEYIRKYEYLEDYAQSDIVPNISLCDFMDIWLKGKKLEIRRSTYEIYSYRVEIIKNYFKGKNPCLADVSPRMLNSYFKYLLQYGKTNQRTGEKEPMSVCSVRDYKNILYSAFNQAVIDGLVRSNPVIGIKIGGKKNKEYSEVIWL